MKIGKRLLINTAIGLTIAALTVGFSSSDVLRRAKLGGLDILFRCKKNPPPKAPIVIIEIDDQNIAKVGRWPWERSWHAGLIKILKDLGAKYVYFDVIFSEKSSANDDTALAEALTYAGNVYLPYVFAEPSFDIKDAILPIERFRSRIKGSGFINIHPDMDGCLRRIPLFMTDGGKTYHHLALELAQEYLGTGKIYHEENAMIISGASGTTRIPLVEGNKMLINWQGRWQDTFTHYSFLDVINAYQNVSHTDLTPIKNSICIVAVTAIGLYDIKPIPLQPEYPAVGMLATSLENIIDSDFIYPGADWLVIILIYLLALLPAWFITENPFKQVFPLFAGPLLFFAAYLMFSVKHIWIDYSLPMVALVISYITVGAYNFAATLWEKGRLFRLAITDGLTGLYNIRYFTERLKEICGVYARQGGKTFCVVMGDIDHFKNFNDSYGHLTGDLVLRETAATLKACLRPDDVIARYGGEEIIMVLQEVNLATGLLVGERMRKAVEERQVENEKGSYKVTISMGVACFRQGDDDQSLISRADEGLYKAKAAGRNRVDTAETV